MTLAGNSHRRAVAPIIPCRSSRNPVLEARVSDTMSDGTYGHVRATNRLPPPGSAGPGSESDRQANLDR